MMQIHLTSDEIFQVNELLAGGFNNKIPAIKVVRAAERHRIPGVLNPLTGTVTGTSGVGLREAKEAVEVLMAERGMKNADGSPYLAPAAPVARIAPLQPIRRVICNFGDGEVELDMDGLSLSILKAGNKLGIDDLRSLLNLWDRVKSWEDTFGGSVRGGQA